MDRLNQIRSETGGSRDLTLDTSSPPSEGFMTANESSSKFYSLSDVDSTFDVSPTKGSVVSTVAETDQTIPDTELISNLSPIPKKAGNYKIGRQIEAANILSGGVNIFDDNDNSYDGDELVIDDNVVIDEDKPRSEVNVAVLPYEKAEENVLESIDVAEAIQSKDSEVVLQIDGRNVDAIDIGNGLYLYRKTGEEELAAVQIVDDGHQQQSFKFLKVRENAEGNLEVYEEIEIEVPKEVPIKEGKPVEKNSYVPIKDISKIICEPSCYKDSEPAGKTLKKDLVSISEMKSDSNIEMQSEGKPEVNINGKMMKFSECRKSPIISTFTPMTYHSTPNKEGMGIPLTKTMVNQQLHPNRHSDNVKKTIEVHTEYKQKSADSPTKSKDLNDFGKTEEPPCLDLHKTELFSPESLTPPKGLKTDKDKCHLSDIDREQECDSKILHEVITRQTVENSVQLKNISKVLRLDCEETTIETNETSTQLLETEKKNDLRVESEEGKIDLKFKNVEQNTAHLNEPVCKINDKIGSNSCKNELSNEVISRVKVMSDSIIVPNKPEIISKTINVSTEFRNQDIDNKSYKCDKETSDVALIAFQETKSDNVNILKNAQNEVKTIISGIVSKDENTEIKGAAKNIEDTKHFKSSYLKEKVLLPGNVIKVDEKQAKYPVKIIDIIKPNDTITEINKDIPVEVKKYLHNSQNKVVSFEEMTNITEKLNVEDNQLKLKVTDRHSKPDTLNESKVIVVTENPVMKIIDEDKSSIITGNIPIMASQSKATTLKTDNFKIKACESISNISNNAAVPFGKWTEANRQEFLNKIKETKIPCSNTNTKQLKQPNDLNRRDVLKKIDSQRQSNQAITKTKELAMSKLNLKTESSAVFINKPIHSQKPNPPESVTEKNTDVSSQNNKNTEIKKISNDASKKPSLETANVSCSIKVSNQRKEIINNQDLIDKTIEGIINRAVLSKPQDEIKQTEEVDISNNQKNNRSFPVSLDEIEKKMNELHGIPFIERPAHELPQVYNPDKQEKDKTSKDNKVPNLLPFINKDPAKNVKENVIDDLSDEEIIEHEPITGDLGRNTQKNMSALPTTESLQNEHTVTVEETKKDSIITEKDFDKFVRRNSITFENCLTVNFDGKETHNVVQTIVEKDAPVKKLSRNELMLAESKAKSTHKHLPQRHSNHPSKIPTSVKPTNINDDTHNKNYQSKVQLAYQSAMTAKRQMECPITIIEDKPVKVVYLNSGADFPSPTHLDVQGQELSPSKKSVFDICDIHSASESIDSDILDVDHSNKSQDESRTKSKHQRKQVLTPVETPELELIEPSDLEMELTAKKKRKIEDNAVKNLVPKKSYLLNRSIMDQKKEKNPNISANAVNEQSKCKETFVSAITAIDNLVKAAELLETQSENKNSPEKNNMQSSADSKSDIPISTPVKRGRGRPRKYPLPEVEAVSVKTPSPQKKPRLIDSKANVKEELEDSSDEEMIQENWTMGKINENIVCPICSKLFRSENVVFKHVKHCTGPSPNRSDSDRTSTRGCRQSQESERKSNSISDGSDSEDDPIIFTKYIKTKDTATKSKDDKDDVIVIKETPKKQEPEESKVNESRKIIVKNKVQPKVDNLTCEFCGKTFRQLSYLVNHKLQHKTEDTKKYGSNQTVENKSVLSCEVCKKDFRKLHHLVQHRIIHNSNALPSRLLRKSSHEQTEAKSHIETKHNDDQSAGFRCEPCDKSFRKLHHLVEHRETHDGINKKSSSGTSHHVDTVKTAPIHVCDICKKTFKKIQQLLEHKEQHLDTCSEKSDDKSVKSSLSTRDIIHECSLCYMVFPNEHSLNKHIIFCLRKKKQSANKQAKLAEEKAKQANCEGTEEKEFSEDDKKHIKLNDNHDAAEVSTQTQEKVTPEPFKEIYQKADVILKDNTKLCEDKEQSDLPTQNDDTNVQSVAIAVDISRSIKSDVETNASMILIDEDPNKTNKIDIIIIPDTPTPKKKSPTKEKANVTKRKKSTNTTLHIPHKQLIESSDDDEVRYMLNPNFKENSNEHKVFMKVRANKRSSLQIERPDSKNLIKRRISLQHPPRVPRLKAKVVERKPSKSDTVIKTISPVIEDAPSTDSDDSDVKYSFPESVNPRNTQKNEEKKIKRQSVAAKRKSIGGIAKRKSLGKHKISNSTQIIRKRTTAVDHRCDCGQLFSSAALLARHTTLAHTPPRIRRRRSPPPEPHEPPQKPPQQPAHKPPHQPPTKPPHEQPPPKPPHQQPHKPSQQPTHKPISKRKTIVDTPKPNAQVKKPKSDLTVKNSTAGAATRKSSFNSEVKSSDSDIIVRSESNTKILRSAAHRGVPVPDKMRKFMEKK